MACQTSQDKPSQAETKPKSRLESSAWLGLSWLGLAWLFWKILRRFRRVKPRQDEVVLSPSRPKPPILVLYSFYYNFYSRKRSFRRVSAERKRKLGLSKDALALIVTFIWGKHAKKAGLRLNDVVLAVDDRRNDMSIRAMHAYLHMNKNYGDVIPIVVRRGGKRLELSMKLPSAPPPP